MNLIKSVEAMETEVARLTSGTPTDVRLATIRREAEPVVNEALRLAQRLVEMIDRLKSLEDATSATMNGFKGTRDEVDNESSRRLVITGCDAIFEVILFMFDHLADYTGCAPRERVPLSELEHFVETFLADYPVGDQGCLS